MNNQKLILLCGVPGSGKSTIATSQFQNLTRINQDELGSRDACLRLCNEALARGESVIIDRCNHTVKQRNEWVKMARVYNTSVHCIYLDIGSQLATARVFDRKDHPTIRDFTLEKVRSIVLRFRNELQIPSMELEAFDSFLHIRVK